MLIPPISFAYLFLSIKDIFRHITHHSTLDRSGLAGPGTYRIIPKNLPGVVVWLGWFCPPVFIGREPAHLRFRISLDHAHLYYFLLLLSILGIKYSMFDVIFVRLMQSLSMVLWKYQPQYAHFCSGTSLDYAHFFFSLLLNILGIKYLMYDAILLG